MSIDRARVPGNPHRGRRRRRARSLLAGRGLLAALVPGLVLGLGTVPVAATEVYRCTSTSGAIEFRQQPCAGTDQAELLHIEEQATGWTPPPGVAAPAGAPPRRPTGPAGLERPAAGESDRCWRRRRQLEDVNRRLRRGYTAVQGQRLRDRRRDYEDYLWRFCR